MDDLVKRNIYVSRPSDGTTLSPGDLYAVCIGVGDYGQDSLRLRYPAKDARDFAEALRSQQGRLYTKVQARVLCDKLASRRKVLEAVDWLRQKTSKSDLAVIFLAGHGCNHLETGDYYFLPWDVETDSLVGTAVAGYELRQQIARIKGKRLLFMDTCRAGNVFSDVGFMQMRGQFGSDTSSFISDLQKAGEALVVFASSTGQQPSAESEKWGNGAFTKALIEGLRGRASDAIKQQVSLNLLAHYVGERVRELTGGLQTPTTAILQTVTDFPLAVGPFAYNPTREVHPDEGQTADENCETSSPALRATRREGAWRTRIIAAGVLATALLVVSWTTLPRLLRPTLPAALPTALQGRLPPHAPAPARASATIPAAQPAPAPAKVPGSLPVARITLLLKAQPKGVRVNDFSIDGRSRRYPADGKLTMERTDREIRITVAARGFAKLSKAIIPDHDQEVVFSLKKDDPLSGLGGVK